MRSERVCIMYHDAFHLFHFIAETLPVNKFGLVECEAFPSPSPTPIPLSPPLPTSHPPPHSSPIFLPPQSPSTSSYAPPLIHPLYPRSSFRRNRVISPRPFRPVTLQCVMLRLVIGYVFMEGHFRALVRGAVCGG